MLLIVFCTDKLKVVDLHVVQAKEVTVGTDKYGLVHYFCICFPLRWLQNLICEAQAGKWREDDGFVLLIN